MNCLSDVILRAKIDDELGPHELRQVGEHLCSCAQCRQRLETMAANSGRVRQTLAVLQPASGASKSPQEALTRFEARKEVEAVAEGWLNAAAGFLSAHPVQAWGSAALATLVLVLVFFAPARTWGQRVLAMLRVQNVTAIPVNFNVNTGPTVQAAIRQLISNEVVETLSPGKPVMASSISEASQLAGFKVRTLTSEPVPPRISVEGEQAYVMTLNRDRLQEILSEIGRPDLTLPASINGATIAVHISKGALVQYGDCPHRGSPGETAQAGQAPNWTGCVMVAQVPSPIVSVPPSLDITQLAEIALQAAGMTVQEADEFCQTVDWTSTLVIPIPSRATSASQVAVDGVEGTLITGKPFHGQAPRYGLIWVKKGIVYSLTGSGDSANAVALADSLS